MLNALANFFSPEAGQSRRRWLNEQEQRLGNALSYYLGPASDPLQSAALLAGYMTPGADMMDASNAGRELFNAETPMDAATAAATAIAAGGMVLLPGNVGALREGFDQSVNALAAYDPTTVNAFRAYHGSPHTFDRFSMDRIGTGEGAQAYGHGLYFAENEAVARQYRDALAAQDAPPLNLMYNGQEIDLLDVPSGLHNLRRDQMSVPYDELVRRAQEEVARAQGFRIPAIRDAAIAKQQPVLDWLMQRPGVEFVANPARGSLYEVQINADPADFLDWDAPLSAQGDPINVATGARLERFLEQAGPQIQSPYDRFISGEMTGEEAYRLFHPQAGVDRVDWSRSLPGQASEALQQAGIPGIRYLDAGSRAAGDGSRNFVVFDDSIINILRRYGIGAAAIGGGWALSPEDAQAATDMGVLDPQQRDRQQITDWLNTL